MTAKEKSYPLIVWFFYKGKKRLFSKIKFCEETDEVILKASALAKALGDVEFSVPIEVSLLTQSAGTPTAVEVIRICGVDMHTTDKESAVFVVRRNEERSDDFKKIALEDIKKVFLKDFSEFREKHAHVISEKRRVAAIEVRRCDEILEKLKELNLSL